MQMTDIVVATIKAQRTHEGDIAIGSNVTFHPARNGLVVAVDGKPIAVSSSRYRAMLEAEKDKRCLVSGLTETQVAITVYAPRKEEAISISGTNGTLTVNDGIVTFTDERGAMESRPITQASFKIESGEELQKRVTVSRLLLVGVFAFALQKSKGGQKFVTVEGSDFCWAVEMPHSDTNAATQFVAKANDISKRRRAAVTGSIDGIADKDGSIHVAIISCPIADELAIGIDARASTDIDSKIQKLCSIGYEIVSVSPIRMNGKTLSFAVSYK